MHCAFTHSEPEGARMAFQTAAGFYGRGFETILRIFQTSSRLAGPIIPLRLRDLLPHLVWTSLFWGGFVFALNSYFQWFVIDWSYLGVR